MRTISEKPVISVISKPNSNVSKKYRSTPKVKRARKYFREYCESSGIHGFRYLAEKRSLCERLLWGIMIITSISLCCYLISRIYKKYDQSPVIVSFSTKETPIFTIPFPAVTVCLMTKSVRTKLNYTKVIHMKEDNETVSPEQELKAQYLSLICEEGIEQFPDNKTFADDFFDKLHEMQIQVSTVLPCVFMGKQRHCLDIFKRIILDEGICYTFNMLDRDEIFRDNVVHYSDYHKNENASEWNIDEGYSNKSKVDTYPRRALLSGSDSALEIMFLQSRADIDYLCVKDVQGYSIVLHTPHSIPQVKQRYFQVPFDTSVIAVIQPKMMTTSEEVKKYDPIDRECYFTNERPLKFFKIYTLENCRLECLTNYTLKRCGCVNFFMPRDNETSICGNGNFNCMRNAARELTEIELNNLINVEEGKKSDIYCDCMPLCTELSFDMEQSQTVWNWNKQLEAVRIPEFKKMRKHIIIAKLSVFFKTEHFLTSQRNELYGPTDFLANFGGLLGLFTGFSLLSLMEIIYFLTVRIFCNIRQYRVWTGAME
ncbi:pickpocket protein 28-like [Anoplophora glabripennis]|uniref:pickpocket protein 28-like n=1 Tax=Anoplophora glabripennis TaxID=217634 RepID=UPI000875331B|nr:pickpocket protein 28-like [Anoplophora glabripennis]